MGHLHCVIIDGCTIKGCIGRDEVDAYYYNWDVAKRLYGFIKQQQVIFCRLVASISTDTTLFSSAYRNVENIIRRLVYMVLAVTGINYYEKRYKGSQFIGYMTLPILLLTNTKQFN